MALTVVDANGQMVPQATNQIRFRISGPGEIVATDNGDPTSFELFRSHERKAFNGLCLVIIRGKPGQSGAITLTATADGLSVGKTVIKTIK